MFLMTVARGKRNVTSEATKSHLSSDKMNCERDGSPSLWYLITLLRSKSLSSKWWVELHQVNTSWKRLILQVILGEFEIAWSRACLSWLLCLTFLLNLWIWVRRLCGKGCRFNKQLWCCKILWNGRIKSCDRSRRLAGIVCRNFSLSHKVYDMGYTPVVVCTTALPYSLCGTSTSRIKVQSQRIIYRPNWWDEEVTQRGDLWWPCQGMTGVSIKVLKVRSSPSMHCLLYLCVII